ncbi:MAG: CPBP family intramembrane metalloprotease [Anaerolineae bacterium]|nr:CPBP family intramembrane metalloprotease [Anaerolineae bacterium]
MSPTIYPDPRPEPEAIPPQPVTPPPQPENAAEPDYESPFADPQQRRTIAYRGSANDPVFGYLIVIALSVGLTPLIADNPDLRYAILWMVMAGFGVLAWLMGSSARISQETPENLVWGVAFGIIVSVPLLMVGGSLLTETTARLFPKMGAGSVLVFLVFAMPLAETLFFRGVLQETRAFWMVGLMSSLWSVLVLFPLLEVNKFPAVAVIIGTAFLMMNITYSYVRQRNGLAAAWICQIAVNLVLLFLPFLS